VRQYQRNNNLPVDGYVGYQLLHQLQAPWVSKPI
jgi:peptidoglycan hydrolase-like protein with peptidoglycan-binding domain